MINFYSKNTDLKKECRKLHEVRFLLQGLNIPFILVICRRKPRFQQMQDEMLVDLNFSCKNVKMVCSAGREAVTSHWAVCFWSSPPDRNTITTAARWGRSSSERLCCRSSSHTCCSSSRRPARLWVSNNTSHVSTLLWLLNLFEGDCTVLYYILATSKALSKNVWKDKCVGKLWMCIVGIRVHLSFSVSILIMITSNQEDW